METIEQTDEQLAALAAREGSDGPAFTALVECFRARVWRVCYRLLGNEQDASDAAQEVFVRLFLNRAKFEGRSKYATWVHAIAVRTCLTIRRSRSPPKTRETLGPGEEWEQQQPEIGHRGPLARPDEDAGKSWTKKTWLLILKYAEGHDYEELSAIFQLSPSACKMRISRAREKLQQRFPDQKL